MKNDEWLTPPEILRALGDFDLDPCAPIRRPWDMAKWHYDINDNGLGMPWRGRVWLNPPYGREAADWLRRLADHGNGVALIFARTETEMFFDHVWERADALLFLRGRLHFHYVDGRRAKANGGAPSVLIAYGESNAECLLWRVAEVIEPGSSEKGMLRDWIASIQRFNERLGVHAVLEFAEIARTKYPYGGKRTFLYFCGVCWNHIRQGDNRSDC